MNKPHEQNYWTEIYDSKDQRIKQYQQGAFVRCPKCKEWRGHNIDCPDVTVEALASQLHESRQNEMHARANAARYLAVITKIYGKMAMLRHEANKLREKNRKLKKLLRDAQPIIEADAAMMAGITRFAPLSPELQAKHDSTVYPSETWIEEYQQVIGEELRMPILSSSRLPGFPKFIMIPISCDARAQKNHSGQSLVELGRRGGVSPEEAVAIVEDREWRKMDLPELVDAFRKHSWME